MITIRDIEANTIADLYSAKLAVYGGYTQDAGKEGGGGQTTNPFGTLSGPRVPRK